MLFVGPAPGEGWLPEGLQKGGPRLCPPQQTGSLWISWKSQPRLTGAVRPLGPPSRAQPTRVGSGVRGWPFDLRQSRRVPLPPSFPSQPFWERMFY